MGKKRWCIVLILLLYSFCGCKGKSQLPILTTDSTTKQLDSLSIGIVPMAKTQELVESIEPLKELLIQKLKEKGWQISEVLIHVGSSYESVGNALQNGTVDLAIISQEVYEEYKENCIPLLRALRYQLSKDFSQKDTWRDSTATKCTRQETENYRGILLAGSSSFGKDLVNKVQQGQTLTFEMLSQAKWSVLKQDSPAGKVFANKWLQKNYKKTLEDLPYLVEVEDYYQAFARLANHRADVIWVYSDARMEFESYWKNQLRMESSIWEDTAVIAVSQIILNEVIAITTHSSKMTTEFQQAIQDIFIELLEIPEGRNALAGMGHIGYKKL